MASVGNKSSIAESVAEDGDMYSPHGIGAGRRSNKPEGVAFASSRNSTQGSTPQEGIPSTPEKSGHFTVQVRRTQAKFGGDRTRRRRNNFTYEYTHRHLSFIYRDDKSQHTISSCML